jgi:alanine racemase
MDGHFLKWIKVDLDRIKQNISLLRSGLAPSTKWMAVVKGDGYGLGIVPVAKAAAEAGTDWLCVAGINEAEELRSARIQLPILNVTPVVDQDIPKLLKLNLSQSVYKLETATRLSQLASTNKMTAHVHIKMDTGLRRVGIHWEEATDFIKKIAALPAICIDGLFSSLAESEEESPLQLQRLEQVRESCKKYGISIPLVHISSSFAFKGQFQLDMVRVGIGMYGLSPLPDSLEGIKPAYEFKTKVDLVKPVKAAQGVGYGFRHKFHKNGVLATLPVGWIDGLNRALSNKGFVLIHGERAPIVGLVSMNHTLVDVTEIPDVKENDEVVLTGRQGNEEITVDEIAKWCDTSNYFVLCSLGPSVPRIYYEGGRPVMLRTTKAVYSMI